MGFTMQVICTTLSAHLRPSVVHLWVRLRREKRKVASMAFTLYSLIQTAILCTNAIAVLHEERFLSKSMYLVQSFSSTIIHLHAFYSDASGRGKYVRQNECALHLQRRRRSIFCLYFECCVHIKKKNTMNQLLSTSPQKNSKKIKNMMWTQYRCFCPPCLLGIICYCGCSQWCKTALHISDCTLMYLIQLTKIL